ncbi:MAG: helix-turn-helix domain-containing protein [Pseudomonadota bacterium]
MHPAKINVPPSPRALSRRSNAIVLACSGQGVFELGIACEIFGFSRPELGEDWYRFAVCAAERAPLNCIGGAAITTEAGLEAVEDADLVIVPGWRPPLLDVPAALCDALRGAHRRGARLVSFCTGSFVLAAAGVLSGRRATTHYRWTELLAKSFPDVQVEPDVLYIEDRGVYTSAGGAAGIDLGLFVVGQDFGADVANSIAQRMVVQPHRAGVQQQFIQRPFARDTEAGRLAATLDFMRQNLAEKITVHALANHARMSARTFARRFLEATGQAPGEWLVAERVARARDLLETSSARVEDIAIGCGFGTSANMRRHFQRTYAKNPRHFR